MGSQVFSSNTEHFFLLSFTETLLFRLSNTPYSAKGSTRDKEMYKTTVTKIAHFIFLNPFNDWSYMKNCWVLIIRTKSHLNLIII